MAFVHKRFVTRLSPTTNFEPFPSFIRCVHYPYCARSRASTDPVPRIERIPSRCGDKRLLDPGSWLASCITWCSGQPRLWHSRLQSCLAFRDRSCLLLGPVLRKLHTLAGQWPVADREISNVFDCWLEFFSRSVQKTFYRSSFPLHLPQSPSIPPYHPSIVCFICDTPISFRQRGCYFLLIRSFHNDVDTVRSCCTFFSRPFRRRRCVMHG